MPLDFTLPADSLFPGVVPAQDARCLAVGNLFTSAPVSANDHVCDQGADPGDGADKFAEPLKRLDHHLDPLGQLVDRRSVPDDQIQVHACEERVVLVEPAQVV